jgi:lipopolysaccharide transport system ATP-binding protein
MSLPLFSFHAEILKSSEHFKTPLKEKLRLAVATKTKPSNKVLPGTEISPATQPEVIVLDSVNVTYQVPRERIASLKEYSIKFLKEGIQNETFHALKNLSLQVKKGDVFGIVGRNGAGKSTLLKVISRVLKPQSGRVLVRGRIAPMLELGAGFHPELTGRENVLLNGTILGYSKAEMLDVFNQIVDFAEIHDFIDAPVRTYSNGMTARLGFAVATAHQPDILIIDEALSVGDERFQQKCFARINQYRESGTTFLLVTHNSEFIRSQCNQALWLDRGKVRLFGEADRVIDKYQEFISAS